MKVHYKKPINDQLADVIHGALSRLQKIDYIELTPTEWDEFSDYVRVLCQYPIFRADGSAVINKFMGVDIRKESSNANT